MSVSLQQQPAELRFIAASQPDIIRSAQKDDLYVQQTIEACHDLVRRVAGAYPALQYARETRLAAELLYHGLTTGVGMQTLGEEYCSMSQVTGDGLPPSAPRRLALAALRALGPYVASTAASKIESAHQRSQWGAGAEDAGSLGEDGDAQGPPTGPEIDGTPGGTANSGVLGVLYTKLHRKWSASMRAIIARWPQLQPLLSGAARGHLAFFYVYGVYYLIWHRLAGTRYISTTRQLQGKPTYKLLGVALLAQLGLSALLTLQRTVLHAAAKRRAAVTGVPLTQITGQHAVLLDDMEPRTNGAQGDTSSSSHAAASHAGLQGDSSSDGAVATAAATSKAWQVATEAPHTSRGTCALCLNTRNHPTSTPCGHVFCWSCVAAWCNEKPECPLCRATVLPPQLVPLHHCSLF